MDTPTVLVRETQPMHGIVAPDPRNDDTVTLGQEGTECGVRRCAPGGFGNGVTISETDLVNCEVPGDHDAGCPACANLA